MNPSRLVTSGVLGLSAIAACLSASATVAAQSCKPRWIDFWTGSGPNLSVSAIAELSAEDFAMFGWVVGGPFQTIGGEPIPRIALWDGSGWRALGSGVNGNVWALEVFDDGSGLALFVGGEFTMAGGAPAMKVARWDGQNWSQVGGGLGSALSTGVLDFEVYDEGDGPRLFAAGFFSGSNGVPVRGIARWDGVEWSVVGEHLMQGGAECMAVHDDGEGPQLYVGGAFRSMGTVVGTNALARWNGKQWSSVDGGLLDFFATVSSLASFREQGQTSLFVGLSNFSQPDFPVLHRFRDGVLEPFSGLVGYDADQIMVHCLTVHNDGTGEALYIGGRFLGAGSVASSNIVKWNGNQWLDLGTGTDHTNIFYFGDVVAMCPVQSEADPTLLIGGYFDRVDGSAASANLAAWVGCDPACAGDINGDNFVDFADLNILLQDFNTTAPGLPGDIDDDGDVDFADLNLLLGVYNSAC